MISFFDRELKNITPQEFAQMGISQFAYIRAGAEGYVIYGADGRMIVTVETLPLALEALAQNDMFPITLH